MFCICMLYVGRKWSCEAGPYIILWQESRSLIYKIRLICLAWPDPGPYYWFTSQNISLAHFLLPGKMQWYTTVYSILQALPPVCMKYTVRGESQMANIA